MLIFVRMFFKGFISLLFLHNAPAVRQFVLQVNLFQSTTHYFVLHQVIHINPGWFEFNLDQFANLSFVLICFFFSPLFVAQYIFQQYTD